MSVFHSIPGVPCEKMERLEHTSVSEKKLQTLLPTG